MRLALLALALLLATSLAAAAPPTLGGGGAGPEEQACAGRSVSDACTLPNNQLGTCAQGTCNRLDYSGGSPPKATEEACVVCKPGGAAPEAGEAGDPPPAEPATSADRPIEPPTSESRCTVVPEGSNPAGFALALGLLFGIGRTRRRPDKG